MRSVVLYDCQRHVEEVEYDENDEAVMSRTVWQQASSKEMLV